MEKPVTVADPQQPFVALIVGVTGMAGLSLAEALKSPKALGGPWKVYGSALRPMPTWFPSSVLDKYIAFDATDGGNTANKLAPFSGEVTHLFWLAIQVRESEQVNVTVNATMLSNVLNVLKGGPGSRLSHDNVQTGTQHYKGPIHNLSESGRGFNPHEPPFVEDLPRLPYPNFYYALEDLVQSYVPGLTYSVHRSSIIIGASSRSVYNALLTLAVYASICRHDGSPFWYIGNQYTWEHFCDMSDARVTDQTFRIETLARTTNREVVRNATGLPNVAQHSENGEDHTFGTKTLAQEPAKEGLRGVTSLLRSLDLAQHLEEGVDQTFGTEALAQESTKEGLRGVTGLPKPSHLARHLENARKHASPQDLAKSMEDSEG